MPGKKCLQIDFHKNGFQTKRFFNRNISIFIKVFTRVYRPKAINLKTENIFDLVYIFRRRNTILGNDAQVKNTLPLEFKSLEAPKYYMT